ncbi:hypothetical protein PCL_07267 [Purpureocillium lilacinum]|uniref:C2H2-type domain-containing protein n=1 Tax=Purpureocillium lilacinum TaxID=33203 RepID=A0A2U3DSI6_PURLI|nr:hypothetical protein PCL_07267 [Purpureocillium lilacinum]
MLASRMRLGGRDVVHDPRSDLNSHNGVLTNAAYRNMTKLSRSMTDVYNDELYPRCADTASASLLSQNTISSNSNSVFAQRIDAANSHYLSATSRLSATTTKARSPFRTGSQYAPSEGSDTGASRDGLVIDSAQWMGSQSKARHNVACLQQQADRSVTMETMKITSPKEVVLELDEIENRGLPPFAQVVPDSKACTSGQDASFGLESSCLQANDSHISGVSSTMGYRSSQASTDPSVLQQYPSATRARSSHETRPSLSLADSGSVGATGHMLTNSARPDPKAGSGVYSCTYRKCTLRFGTPSLLKKHKRESHRKTLGLLGHRLHRLGSTQDGPHRCDSINPITAKACNAAFTRPYDLTRHEDTIHNAGKQRLQCGLCMEEKSFSRADALTRHYRVCHAHMDVPGN